MIETTETKIKELIRKNNLISIFRIPEIKPKARNIRYRSVNDEPKFSFTDTNIGLGNYNTGSGWQRTNYINTQLQTPYRGLTFSPYLDNTLGTNYLWPGSLGDVFTLGVLAHQNINNFNISIDINKGSGELLVNAIPTIDYKSNQILLGVETSVSKIDIGLQITRISTELMEKNSDSGGEAKSIIYELYAKYSLPQYRGSDIGDLKFMYLNMPSHSFVTFVTLENDVEEILPIASVEAVAIFYKRNLTKNLSVELGTVKGGGEYDSFWKINVKL